MPKLDREISFDDLAPHARKGIVGVMDMRGK